MKKLIFILFLFSIFYSCSKKESTPSVVLKLSGCDSLRLGILKPNTQDTLRLLSCVKISGCDSVRLGLLKSTLDLLRLNCYSLSISIGTQKWMTVNLDVVTYRNGDTIPQVTDPKAWAGLTTGAWCYYNNDPNNGAIYSKLYNWYAVNDPRGLTPKGWHIPTDAEWTELGNFLGGDAIAGGKMKVKGTTIWAIPNADATNESGYAGLPGGYRLNDGYSFFTAGYFGCWWSAKQSNSTEAWSRYLLYNFSDLYRNSVNKKNGFSVRCLRD